MHQLEYQANRSMKSRYHLIPVYGQGDTLLVIHELDFEEGKMVVDGLMVSISLARRDYKPAISGQRYLKFCPCEPIPIDERTYWIHRMESLMPASGLQEIEESLRYPSIKAIKTLCWVPERLKGYLSCHLSKDLLCKLRDEIGVN